MSIFPIRFNGKNSLSLYRVAPETILYDQTEDEHFYTGVFEIALIDGVTLKESITSLNGHVLADSAPEFSSDLVEAIVQQCGFERHWGDASAWSDPWSGISVKYALRPADKKDDYYLILSSAGEKQPTRFVIIIHGVWRLNTNETTLSL